MASRVRPLELPLLNNSLLSFALQTSRVPDPWLERRRGPVRWMARGDLVGRIKTKPLSNVLGQPKYPGAYVDVFKVCAWMRNWISTPSQADSLPTLLLEAPGPSLHVKLRHTRDCEWRSRFRDSHGGPTSDKRPMVAIFMVTILPLTHATRH